MSRKNTDHTRAFDTLPNGQKLNIKTLSGRGKTRFFVVPNIDFIKRNYGTKRHQ